ncbi:MAPEG family protein [Roseibacterium sp. SDUM158017]|uniref:MAPEG family protein n=1 Tax=Roseicyclus salinarum TaxID=3036773 RepID=UPI0024155FB2|nr:MAPEG family protein [Roseibacterium sp. SDUM158017]MDG4647909.1 MAPEG family protein [Roseibacterium sp. SDUM158017]
MTPVDLATLIVGLSLAGAVSAQAVHSDIAFGFRYSASVRDEERSDVLSRRLARVVRNQVEGVAMFAPIAILAGSGSENGVLGWACLVYAASRALHGILQAFGAGPIRSITWLTGFAALLVAYVNAALTLA